MLDIRGLSGFTRSVQGVKARAEGQITKKYKAFVTEVFEDLVMRTPQWSGNLAANWQVRLTNEGPASKHSWYKKGHTGGFSDDTYNSVKLGDGEAPMAAIQAAIPQINKIRWNSRVRIENPVAYADLVSDGLGPRGRELRPEHVPPFEMMMYYIVNKYNRGEIVMGPSL